MAKMILGVIPEKVRAEHAVDELQTMGFNPKDISIIMRDERGKTVTSDGAGYVAEGALTGATTGGLLGGLTGLLIGIGAITIPGIGAILIGGPIAAALGLTGAAASTVTGAVTGALAGGVVGALVGIGVPEEDAKYYEEQIKMGAVLIAVPVLEEYEDRARNVLEDHGASQIRTIDMATPRRERYVDDPYYNDDRYDYGYASGSKGGEVSDDESIMDKIKRKLRGH